MALLIGWFLSLVFVCTVGQRLMFESANIGHLVASSNWFNLESDTQKDLILVMMRCQKPVFIRAGPFGYMSYATIIAILKTAYSYFTLMSRTK